MISDRLKSLRESTGMSARKFAESIGMKYTTYYGYETGAREPGSEFLTQIADYFEVTTDYILCRTNDPNQEVGVQLTDAEKEAIKKYRALDERGKEIVSTVLEIEYRHVTQNHIVQFAARGGGLQSVETNASDADIAAALDELEDDISDNL